MISLLNGRKSKDVDSVSDKKVEDLILLTLLKHKMDEKVQILSCYFGLQWMLLR